MPTAWIILDLQRSVQTGRGEESTVEAAIRAAASIADRALQENRAVGLTVNVGRTAFLPADRGGRFAFEPGWRWSECVKPVAGTDSCQARHVRVVHAGRLAITHEDGNLHGHRKDLR